MNSSTESDQVSGEQLRILLASTVDLSNLFYDGIVQRLSRQGWDVHVLSSSGPIGRRLFGNYATFHDLDMNRGVAPVQDLVALWRWVRLLVQVRPDVLVVGTPKASLLGGLAGRLCRIPEIVHVIHGMRSETTEGIVDKVIKTTEMLTIRAAHHVIAVSESLKMAVIQTHPSADGRITVLGSGSLNGVDKIRFNELPIDERLRRRAELGFSAEDVVLGFVGRLHRDKGGKFLLDLLEDPRIAAAGLKLLIIGDVEDKSLLSAVDELISRGVVILTGWRDDPENLIPAMDLLVHPTLREGLGMSLLEAQAAGIPVLTNRVTGAVDAVLEGAGGKFAETNSIESWSQNILELTANLSELNEMGQRGRDFVDSRFERSKVVDRVADYLTQVYSKSSKGTRAAVRDNL